MLCCRSSINTLVSLKRAMETCTNRPVVPVDGGRWYQGALDRYGLKRRHITFGERNAIGVLRVRGEDQTVLRQPPLEHAGQPQIVQEAMQDLAHPSEEASETRKDTPGGDVIVTVSALLRGDLIEGGPDSKARRARRGVQQRRGGTCIGVQGKAVHHWIASWTLWATH